MKRPEVLAPGRLSNHNEEEKPAEETGSAIVAALKLAAQGISVFPCRQTKAPYTPHGFKDASTDVDLIRHWWARWPDALVGVPTGAVNGLAVVDVDDMDALKRLPGALPKTRVHHTRSGGRHYLYEYTPGAGSKQGVVPGVDVRGDGGYIIWWPAHGGKVEDRGADTLPAWAYAARAAPAKVNGAVRPAQAWDVARAVIARELKGLDPDCGYEEWYRIGMAIHHESGGAQDALDLWEQWSAQGSKYRPGECAYKWASFKTNQENRVSWATVAKPKAPPPAQDSLIDRVDTLLDTEFEPTKRIFTGVLPLTPGVWLLAGRPKDGKSWLAMNLMGAVVSDQEFFGCKGVDGPGLAVYMALDDNSKERFTNRCREMGVTREMGARMILVSGIPEEFDSTHAFLENFLAKQAGVKFVVYDTLSAYRIKRRSDVYQQEYEEIKALNDLAQRHGVCIILIHHTNKAKFDPEDPFTSISGTLGLQGGGTGMLVMTRKDYRNPMAPSILERLGAFYVKGRDIEEIDIGARLLDGQWRVIGNAHDVLFGETLREVLRVLRSDMTKVWSSKEVAAQVEGHTLATVRKALQRAVGKGAAVAMQGAYGGYRAIK